MRDLEQWDRGESRDHPIVAGLELGRSGEKAADRLVSGLSPLPSGARLAAHGGSCLWLTDNAWFFATTHDWATLNIA